MDYEDNKIDFIPRNGWESVQEIEDYVEKISNTYFKNRG